MNHDRLTLLQVSGFKSLSDVEIALHGLTVLIGENGTGKSAILEALSIYASAAEHVVHVTDVLERRFGKFERVLCSNNSVLRIEGTLAGAGEELHYGFSIASSGVFPEISDEWLYKGPRQPRLEENLLLSRRGQLCRFRRADGTWQEGRFGEQALALGYLGLGASPEIARVLRVLETIQVHAPFDARPIWQQRDLGISEGPRWPQAIEPAHALRRYGINLASAFHQLRNTGGDLWQQALALAQLGLGDDLRDIRLPATGRGSIELELVFGALPRPIAAETLSEGQICYLCFIALTHLSGTRAALAIDECELHLHPDLLARVVWMLEDVAKSSPVLMTTHADRMLDALHDTAKSVLLCELDEQRCTRLRRVDPAGLAAWLENYGGLGSLRAEGLMGHVFSESVSSSGETQ